MRHLIAVALLLAACSEEPTPPPPTEPVYFGQVQRIVNENCVECHSASPERLAPFSLATYEDVLAAATDMPLAYAVMNRNMPPFYADQDSCNTFSNAHWLSQEDIDTLVAWTNGAKLAGDEANAVTTPPPNLPTLSRVDRTLDIGAPYTPGTGAPDEFRCFLVDAIGAGKFVTGVHVRPTNLTVAHHAILFQLETDAAEAAAIASAANGPYDCPGSPKDGTFLTGWVPGMQAALFPPGTGIATNSRKMVVQMHYNTSNGDGEPDHTTIDLQLADSVAQPAQMVRISGDVDLPPRDPDATAVGTLTVPGSGAVAKLWGTGIHMHQRGTGTQLTRNNECLLDLVNWSFHWQHFYWYDAPVELRGGDRIELTCHYDTSLDNQRVGFCEGTECEMCIQVAYVTAN
jgi:hypothetical protein